MKNNNTIIWVMVGIILLVIVYPKLPFLHGNFAIITETTCAEGVTNYYSLDGNLLDQKGNLDLINHGTVFINGKINQGIQFNGTNYVSFPSIPSNVSVKMWLINYSNIGSTWYYDMGLPLSGQFGLGFNGSVDEIIVGNNLGDLSTIQACYQTTVYENVTCQEYAVSQQPDQTSGCLNFSGSYFPNCSYSWENQTTYKIENNLCKKNYLCQSSCLPSNGCYPTTQNCVENLAYDCYILQDNSCLKKTDFSSCVLNTTYSNAASCQEHIVVSTYSVNPTETTTQNSVLDGLTQERFKIFGISINAIYLIVALIIIIGLLYLLGAFKGK